MMKHDFKVTIYLLPHILVYVLLGCNQEDQQEVRVNLFGFQTCDLSSEHVKLNFSNLVLEATE
jgi:hypothetical protein